MEVVSVLISLLNRLMSMRSFAWKIVDNTASSISLPLAVEVISGKTSREGEVLEMYCPSASSSLEVGGFIVRLLSKLCL
jgi:hypothetical protein